MSLRVRCIQYSTVDGSPVLSLKMDSVKKRTSLRLQADVAFVPP